jgi:hypothetical protein
MPITHLTKPRCAREQLSRRRENDGAARHLVTQSPDRGFFGRREDRHALIQGARLFLIDKCLKVAIIELVCSTCDFDVRSVEIDAP